MVEENSITPCHAYMFLNGTRNAKRVVRRWKMTPRVGDLQQAGLRSTLSRKSRWCVAIVCWLFEWLQVSWPWKRTVLGRLLPKIWACLKSNRTGCAVPGFLKPLYFFTCFCLHLLFFRPFSYEPRRMNKLEIFYLVEKTPSKVLERLQ